MPCGKDTCALCGRINKQRRVHIAKGKDPDSIESVLADVQDSFAETRAMLQKDAKRFGINLENLKDVGTEPPENSNHPVVKRLMRFYKTMLKVSRDAQESFQAWPKTEAGKDFVWYPSMILIKTKRLLDDRWEIEQGEDYFNDDVEYTRYVLQESVLILKNALTELIVPRTHQLPDFNYCYDELESLEKAIMKI